MKWIHAEVASTSRLEISSHKKATMVGDAATADGTDQHSFAKFSPPFLRVILLVILYIIPNTGFHCLVCQSHL